MTASIPLADRLIERFKATFTKPPSWAWPFQPSIPLIGRGYKPGCSLLVYASAENLNNPTEQELREYFQEPVAWNRYRVQYDTDVRGSHNKFFPDVGIQPVTNGGLFAAALFVTEHCNLPTAAKPRTFLEKIAVSNWCKFSIKADRNVDYIGNLGKLTESLPFVVGELAELQPAVVLLPKQVWTRDVLRAAMRGASPRTQFLPAYQFNATVVNMCLTKYTAQAQRLQDRAAQALLGEWMANLEGFNKENAWRYIAYLNATVKAGTDSATRTKS